MRELATYYDMGRRLPRDDSVSQKFILLSTPKNMVIKNREAQRDAFVGPYPYALHVDTGIHEKIRPVFVQIMVIQQLHADYFFRKR